ncbi:MAG: 5-deoxy-glucuronate isomerase [Chloroflexi bacterium]|nr:5-deoxy-glucuronate isomerase [Chloroflexota bacterium]MCL5107830.1 5-deoxy-glucuronate isomerase [Chloroflexota bacterium]
MVQEMFKVPAGAGYVPVVGEANAALRHLSFDCLRLSAGQFWSGESGDEEVALVTVGGKFSLKVEGRHAADWSSIGGRANVFAGNPAAACVPRRSAYKVGALSNCEIAVFKAKTDADAEPALVNPDEVGITNSGTANWRRDVRLIFPPGSGKTTRLIIGETLNPPGNWSGVPPHKHDALTGEEFPLEEVYYFRTLPSDGFGVQLFFGGKEAEAAHFIYDNTAAVFRSGYHTTGALPGVQVSYLWALAGSERTYKITTDPRFRWLANAEPVLRESQKYYR